MRRTATAAALLLVPALLLTGCGSSTKSKSSDTASPSASAGSTAVPSAVDSADPMPTVGGTFGSSATLTTTGTPSGQFVVHTVTQGTGATIGTADTAISNVLVKDWTTGKTVSDSYASKTPLAANANGMITALKQALIGHKVGSRVLVVAPPSTAAVQLSQSSSLGVAATDTLAMVVDITGSVSSQGMIAGTQQPAPAGMPVVDATQKKAATITIPKGAKPPTTLQTAVLIKGTGPKVVSGQTLITQYTGVTWADGKTFDSSWNDSGASSFQIGVGAVVKGWDQSLVGQTIGSRVEVVIPPSLGYGATPPSGIPANATLVFVVDILAAA